MMSPGRFIGAKQNWFFLSSYEAHHKNVYGIIRWWECEMVGCNNVKDARQIY